MDRVAASGLTMLIPIGFMLGAPLSGVLADRLFQNRADLAILLISIIVCTWIFVVFIPTGLGVCGMGLVFFALGGTSGGMASTLWGAVRENAPPAFLGTTTGLLNVFPLFGMAVMQGVTGAILDRSATVQGSYLPASFQNAFLVCLSATGLCFFVCLWMRQSSRRLPQVMTPGTGEGLI